MNNELLSIVSYMERDRGVNREIILQAIESAIQQAARKSMDVSHDLRVEIDRKTLEIKAFDTVTVADDDSGLSFISLRKARALKPDAKNGDTLHATHQQLAEELGSVREIVSRLLKGFAAQGLVALGREQIGILDRNGLKSRADAAR